MRPTPLKKELVFLREAYNTEDAFFYKEDRDVWLCSEDTICVLGLKPAVFGFRVQVCWPASDHPSARRLRITCDKYSRVEWCPMPDIEEGRLWFGQFVVETQEFLQDLLQLKSCEECIISVQLLSVKLFPKPGKRTSGRWLRIR